MRSGLPIPRSRPAGPGEGVGGLADRAGGLRQGLPGPRPGARISAKHTLALINPGGATAAGIVGLAREIRDQVREVFGVDLASEPVLIGVSL